MEKQELSEIDTITLISYFLSTERLTTVPGCFVKLIQSSSTEGARVFYVSSFCQEVCNPNAGICFSHKKVVKGKMMEGKVFDSVNKYFSLQDYVLS